jgi:CoA-transferase family III
LQRSERAIGGRFGEVVPLWFFDENPRRVNVRMVRVMIFSSTASSSSLEGAAVSWKTSRRPGTLGDRGLSPESLAQLRPSIVFVSLCAFSHVGPWTSRRGFDTVVQTVSGINSRQGELSAGASPGPQFYPVSAIDYLTGYLMAFGAMVVLTRRAREGGSWLVRISLAQTGRWLVGRGQCRRRR